MIKSVHAENRQLTRTRLSNTWIVSLSILLILAAITVVPFLAPQDPYRIQMGNRLQSISATHWLGTDHLGRDVLSRVIAGLRTTVGTSLLILAVSLVVGVPLGLLSGFIGGWMDRVFKRVVDAFMTLPDYIFAIVLSGLLGPGLVNLIFAVTAVKWVGYARLVRSTVLAEKQKDYISLSILAGTSSLRIVMRHILPHAIGNVLVLATLDIGKIILMIASLSFLGLGPQPPIPEWGTMLNEGRAYFQMAPHLMLVPGIAVVLTVLLANVLGDKLRDRYDVKTRTEE
ncbi:MULTISPECIES: nickel transporter permease [Paenibacillus]|jgi:peptide/nickel transport system permease protein|uniref:nickel transporter permease n=1 Tax=Paenibacillus TaxID=44249 RepID=UPI0003D2D762|nr:MULTISPECIES: nickel transporter permease [Paenibacillus]AIW40167.1 nickel transporter permease NikC [Paenibacillus polymyxa CR1]ALA42440.1 nickel transporter permease NikC [Paenibacillus peoriae]APQ59615.1 nickel transporter permease NikC [Paenibacillus polymyxa]OMF29948.1 nickel ABC transporter permease subunit NikC [Paenibacillus peoriae]QYK62282.1 Nickel import system permease protein NikC [Paenibacillus sp. S25]